MRESDMLEWVGVKPNLLTNYSIHHAYHLIKFNPCSELRKK
jgi:hypothetical protein